MNPVFPVPHKVAYEDWRLPHNEALLNKALEHPSEITLEEKHKILQWASPDQANENIKEYLPGRTFESLIHHAATDRDSLTYPEFVMLRDGFHILQSLDRMARNAMRSTLRVNAELRSKRDRACRAVLTPEELQAVDNINDHNFIRSKEQAALDQMKQELALTPLWVNKILEREDKAWGYTIYCASNPNEDSADTTKSWQDFQSMFRAKAAGLPFGQEVFGFKRGVTMGADSIRSTKVMDFVDFKTDCSDINSCREDFRRRRDQGLLKPGVLEDVFVFVTAECRDSFQGPSYAWLWAVDPDWTLGGPDEDGYDGRVPVVWGPLFTKFYNFISTGQFTMKEIWQDYKGWGQTLDEPGWLQTQLDALRWPDV